MVPKEEYTDPQGGYAPFADEYAAYAALDLDTTSHANGHDVLTAFLHSPAPAVPPAPTPIPAMSPTEMAVLARHVFGDVRDAEMRARLDEWTQSDAPAREAWTNLAPQHQYPHPELDPELDPGVPRGIYAPFAFPYVKQEPVSTPGFAEYAVPEYAPDPETYADPLVKLEHAEYAEYAEFAEYAEYAPPPEPEHAFPAFTAPAYATPGAAPPLAHAAPCTAPAYAYTGPSAPTYPARTYATAHVRALAALAAPAPAAPVAPVAPVAPRLARPAASPAPAPAPAAEDADDTEFVIPSQDSRRWWRSKD